MNDSFPPGVKEALAGIEPEKWLDEGDSSRLRISRPPDPHGWNVIYEQSRYSAHPSTSSSVEARLAALEVSLRELQELVSEVLQAVEDSVGPAEISVIPGFSVLHPIPVLIEESEDEVLARWVEPALVGIGGSEGQALESLADIVSEVWSDLREDQGHLHSHAQHVLNILERYVAPVSSP